ncbi:hypothetical protein CA267_011735 [Alteromonas pelagimontana]|uniref:CPXCG motif-containing cysteine-rich protein n=1 Tax=Alteromonas pelagimontana TaxID=1858656 RepID=A0A6M4MFG2_9ALTE|nr:hypothetical protein [Alteromonas pelagimontana]QJR81400.1 hypothetical protein CA267_011735 [Alteromonas pelagimontana]
MNANEQHEYMCPHCNHINEIEHDCIRNMYKEQYTKCSECGANLEIVPADGIGDQINLVVSVAAPDNAIS